MKILFVLLALFVSMSRYASAENIILLAMDDIQSYWLEDVQLSVVQTHIDNNIPVTLGVIPGAIEEPLLTKIKEWDNNSITEVAQHDYTHDVYLIGENYGFQYNYLSQGTNLFNIWGIYPKSFVPASGEADDTTVEVLNDLGFHTIYDGIDIDLAPSEDPLVIEDQLHLCEGNRSGPRCNFKEYSVIISEIDQKIEQYGLALILYHMQDFSFKNGNINVSKVNELVAYADSFVQDGYTLMTVEQYYQYVHIEQFNFPLQKGWNLFSPILEPTDTNTDKNISLKQGWNMIGYSSYEPFEWMDAQVDNGIETKTISEAQSTGWLQATIYYFDESEQRYSFVPEDDDYIYPWRGYWLYVFQDGLTLVLPNAGGSEHNSLFTWKNTTVSDGNEFKTVSEAQQANWMQGTIYYFDEKDQHYSFVPGDDDYIYPWRGYWLYSNIDGLSLTFGEGTGEDIVLSSSFDLQFKHRIEDGSIPPRVDTFNAIGSTDPSVSVGLDLYDVRQPPSPPSGDWVQGNTDPNALAITKDMQPYNPNAPDNTWQIKLNAFDDFYVGLTGTAHFELVDPNALAHLPSNALVYLRRLDSSGNLVQYYDLTDLSNHRITWPVTDVMWEHATMELEIVAETIAANSDTVEPVTIDLSDFAVTASDWSGTETTSRLAGDVNGDGEVDIIDLLLQAEYWLFDATSP